MQETNVRYLFFNFWKFILGFNGYLMVDCEGRSGGLVLLWKNTINMHILQYSKFHIHGFV